MALVWPTCIGESVQPSQRSLSTAQEPFTRLDPCALLSLPAVWTVVSLRLCAFAPPDRHLYIYVQMQINYIATTLLWGTACEERTQEWEEQSPTLVKGDFGAGAVC